MPSLLHIPSVRQTVLMRFEDVYERANDLLQIGGIFDMQVDLLLEELLYLDYCVNALLQIAFIENLLQLLKLLGLNIRHIYYYNTKILVIFNWGIYIS